MKPSLSPAAVQLEKAIIQAINDLRELTVEERSEVFGSLTTYVIGHALMDMGVSRSEAGKKAASVIDDICEFAFRKAVQS